MPTLITPARLAIGAVLCLAWAATLALSPDEALAATPVTICAEPASLQQWLDDFDERWNASDAWSLTAQFAITGSISADAEASRLGVYRELLAQLGREPRPRRTKLLKSVDVGGACLVDVQVLTGERRVPGLFLLAPAAGGILAMR